MTARNRQSECRRAGAVFVSALWMVVVMSALAMALALGARTQRNHAANLAAQVQARHVEQAALRYVLRGLADGSGRMPGESDLPCCAVEVGDGAFWIIRPDDAGDGTQRYGLADEGGKIDLNRAPLAVLQKLPDMTVDVAAAIVDWRDSDETITPNGAESEFYLRKTPPYNAKNGPFETVEELRLVAGVTDEILYGEDTNRNGMLDPWENDGDASLPADDRDGKLNRGLAGTTTAFLRWPTQQSGGSQTTDVNSASRQQIEQALAKVMEATRAADLAQQIVRNRPYATIFHLYYGLSLKPEEFTGLEPLLSFGAPSANAFRLNLNAASAAAIECLPGLTEADAAALVEARGGGGAGGASGGASGDSLAWALDVLPQTKLLEAVAAGVTGRSYQCTADIVAVSGDGRAFRRVRYVIDASGRTPRVLYRQDLTHWGWPLDPAILDMLKSAQPLEDVLGDVKTEAGL